jgi:hypothetical protein
VRKIDPLRIFPFYQLNLPFSVPFLQLLFAGYSSYGIIENLKIDQIVNVVSFREASNDLQFVLVDAPNNIVRHTNIERSMFAACQDVNEELVIHP